MQISCLKNQTKVKNSSAQLSLSERIKVSRKNKNYLRKTTGTKILLSVVNVIDQRSKTKNKFRSWTDVSAKKNL